MGILITGASGFIGRLIADEFDPDELHLWSRALSKIEIDAQTKISSDLLDTNWWSSVELPSDVDVIIHLAEPVKKSLLGNEIDCIVRSHCLFMSNALDRGCLVIYPRTAYQLDKLVGAKELGYLEIKKLVFERLRHRTNFFSPILHPLIDSQGSLAKFINFQRKIPMINIFCAFNACIPVLEKKELKNRFKQLSVVGSMESNHWFSDICTIAELAESPNRKNIYWISRIFLSVLTKIKLSSAAILLTQGRQVT